MDNSMQKNNRQPPSELTIDGKKRYSKKSLKYKGIIELCA
jgi:hypothetical protein